MLRSSLKDVQNVSDEVNQTIVDDVNKQQFSTEVTLNKSTGIEGCGALLTWSEIIDANSTKCR